MSDEKFEVPENILRRSAEAKAKALGVPVEQVLEEMKSNEPAEVVGESEAEAVVETPAEVVEESEADNKTVESIPAITIRFAGDSGDGMQLVGTRFTDTSAIFGNDLATLPSFPAEIRAPQGTIAGVSSFQVQIADFDILPRARLSDSRTSSIPVISLLSTFSPPISRMTSPSFMPAAAAGVPSPTA